MRKTGARRHESTHSTIFLLIAFLVIPAALRAQTGSAIQEDSIQEIPSQSVTHIKLDKDKDKKSKKEAEKQTKRILWVVPNFAAVSANTQLPPLTPHGKFVLAFRDSFDYSSFVWTGIISAQSLALNSDPELGSGFKGYARYYWRAFVDGVSGTYFTEAIVPVMTHEDPRYYTLGHGGFFRRTAYALSRTVLTKTDSGGTSFNWSEVGGNACEAALSNLYYPPQERGGTQTLRDWGNQMESAALNNIVKEFWPDIRHRLLRK
jgi:hypothetical protein